MLNDIFSEAWAALQRNRTRSLLTMTGIVWGIVAVTLLIAYGSGFRAVLPVRRIELVDADVLCFGAAAVLLAKQVIANRVHKPA